MRRIASGAHNGGMRRVVGRLAAALAVALAGVVGFAGCAPDRVDGREQDGARPTQAHRAFDGDLPGRLYLARFFRGASGSGPDGWYDRWAAGPAWRFRRVAATRTATPIPPQISPDGRQLLFADATRHLVVQRTATPGGRVVGRRVIVPVSLAHDITVTWAPDSARLLFDGTIGTRTGIWIADGD